MGNLTINSRKINKPFHEHNDNIFHVCTASIRWLPIQDEGEHGIIQRRFSVCSLFSVLSVLWALIFRIDTRLLCDASTAELLNTEFVDGRWLFYSFLIRVCAIKCEAKNSFPFISSMPPCVRLLTGSVCFSHCFFFFFFFSCYRSLAMAYRFIARDQNYINSVKVHALQSFIWFLPLSLEMNPVVYVYLLNIEFNWG